MSRLRISDAPKPRFRGEFLIDIAADIAPVHGDEAYCLRIRALLDELAEQQLADTASNAQDVADKPTCSQELLADREALRADTAAWLRAGAQAAAEGTLKPDKALEEAELARATWKLELKRLSRKLFFVKVIYGDKKPGSEERYAIDLELVVRDGLPPPQNEPGEAKQALFVELYSVLTVIKTVCREMERKTGRWTARFHSRKKRSAAAQRPARTLDDYVRRVHGISVLGLSDSQTLLARQALLSLKQEVLSQQARRIKNGYVTALGSCALLVAALLTLPYFLISFEASGSAPSAAAFFGAGWWADHESFLLVGIGAAVGTWLSFSIRNVQLTFEQLGSVEIDMLNPMLRLLFVLGLTLAAYLLFWTGAISFSIGDMKVDAENLQRSGSIAFLVGLFCGLSERALATAISGRSAAFVSALDAGTPPVAPKPSSR